MKPIATTAAVDTAPPASVRVPLNRFLGLVIVSVLPAVFWTGLIAIIADFLGLRVSWTAMAIIAGAIALFLAVVFAVLSSGGDNRDES